MPVTDGITALTYVIAFGDAHQGQNFESIDEAHFKLKFFKVSTHAGYIEKMTPTSYLLNFIAAFPDENPINRNSIIIPASFTIKTSRTDPLEPQPVMAL